MAAETNSEALQKLLNLWRTDESVGENLVFWLPSHPKDASTSPFPKDLNENIISALKKLGIQDLYTHQAEAWKYTQMGRNITVTTGTASGKSLCYNLPLLNRFIMNRETCALYLFPTKALAQDQEKGLRTLLVNGDDFSFTDKWIGLYDGDTSSEKRRSIKKDARFVFSNPDMLHQGILPFHTGWARFFTNLEFIILDEIHTYRGVFGSHVANVIRRLKRITDFYGSRPQFVMTSATIANPDEFSTRLIEAPVQVILHDGSPKGKKNLLFYNPPVIQKELGIRRSAASEAVRLSSDLLTYNIQTLIFAPSRRSVEFTLMNLLTKHPDMEDSVFSYRSGYLPRERRFIEKKIKDGTAKAIVSTNALELGIDIGSLDAIVMMGYPGTISGFHQQAGRAGRNERESVVVMVASSKPLDQFLLRNPDYLLSNSVEHALINPDNPIILLQHIRCAIYELAFSEVENFGKLDQNTLSELLDVLQIADNIHYRAGKFFWISDQFPAGEVSLRAAGDRRYLIQVNDDGKLSNIGEIDNISARWMAHPQSIYLHAGQFYLVTDSDDENLRIALQPVDDSYYTEPRQKTSVAKRKIFLEEKLPVGLKTFGEIQVTSQVIGYKKIDYRTNEVLSTHQLEMPETQLITTGAWLTIHDTIIDTLRQMNLWNDDRNDYGANWQIQRSRALERDQYTCQVCGKSGDRIPLHVHHRSPFRNFSSYLAANNLNNLVTLCASCHLKAETVVRIRGGLGGLGYVIHHLAPLILMCSYEDIGVYTDANASIVDGNPCILVYDQVPAGIGLSESIYENFNQLLRNAYQLVSECECENGCPSCVGAPGEQAVGTKQYTKQLLSLLNHEKRE